MCLNKCVEGIFKTQHIAQIKILVIYALGQRIIKVTREDDKYLVLEEETKRSVLAAFLWCQTNDCLHQSFSISPQCCDSG